MTGRLDVVGVGENSIDVVYQMPGAARRVSPGGQLATTLCTCAAMGLRVAYLGTFGDDGNGTLIRRELEARGVDVTGARTRRAPNRYAVILVDARGERTVFWHRDASLRLEPGDIPRDVIAGARLVHVDNVDEEAAIRAARFARDAGRHVTTDIDRVTPRTGELVGSATVPILAEHVPRALTGESDPEHGLRALRRRHDGMLCVTLGARGAMLLYGQRLYQIGAYPIQAVDTTGAGDVFRGAFIHALLRGDSPERILRFANAAAALSCTREGAIGGVPTQMDVDAFRATYGEAPMNGAG
jgi:sugar/nucleoside kinase (ribokinase family)